MYILFPKVLILFTIVGMYRLSRKSIITTNKNIRSILCGRQLLFNLSITFSFHSYFTHVNVINIFLLLPRPADSLRDKNIWCKSGYSQRTVTTWINVSIMIKYENTDQLLNQHNNIFFKCRHRNRFGILK